MLQDMGCGKGPKNLYDLEKNDLLQSFPAPLVDTCVLTGLAFLPSCLLAARVFCVPVHRCTPSAQAAKLCVLSSSGASSLHTLHLLFLRHTSALVLLQRHNAYVCMIFFVILRCSAQGIMLEVQEGWPLR